MRSARRTTAQVRTLSWSRRPLALAHQGHLRTRRPITLWPWRFLSCLARLFACVAILEEASSHSSRGLNERGQLGIGPVLSWKVESASLDLRPPATWQTPHTWLCVPRASPNRCVWKRLPTTVHCLGTSVVPDWSASPTDLHQRPKPRSTAWPSISLTLRSCTNGVRGHRAPCARECGALPHLLATRSQLGSGQARNLLGCHGEAIRWRRGVSCNANCLGPGGFTSDRPFRDGYSRSQYPLGVACSSDVGRRYGTDWCGHWSLRGGSRSGCPTCYHSPFLGARDRRSRPDRFWRRPGYHPRSNSHCGDGSRMACIHRHRAAFYSAEEGAEQEEVLAAHLPSRQELARGMTPDFPRKPKTLRRRGRFVGTVVQPHGTGALHGGSDLGAAERPESALQDSLAQQRASPPPRASQMPVGSTVQGVANFAKMMGSPPRTKALVAAPPILPTVTSGLDGNVPPQAFAEEASPMAQADPFARAMLEQSTALMTLVAHMQQGGDPLLDGQGSSSSGSLGTRGSVGREKLQKELASRSGSFFLAVPAKCCEKAKAGQPQAIFDRGHCRRGLFDAPIPRTLWRGYGQYKELGLIQYALALHLRCSCPFGPERCQRLSESVDGRSGSSKSGRQQMGTGIQDDASGRAAITALELQEPQLRTRGQRVFLPLPPSSGPPLLWPTPKRWITSKQRGQRWLIRRPATPRPILL